jgi:hypothetical protein
MFVYLGCVILFRTISLSYTTVFGAQVTIVGEIAKVLVAENAACEGL